MRYETGLLQYRVEKGAFPPCTSNALESVSRDSFPADRSDPVRLSAMKRYWTNEEDAFFGRDGYVRYELKEYFSPRRGADYCYYTDWWGFVVWSAGKDRDYDLTLNWLEDLPKSISEQELKNRFAQICYTPANPRRNGDMAILHWSPDVAKTHPSDPG